MFHQDSYLEMIIKELQAKFQCHTFILYGSRARDDAKETSDYDIMGIAEAGDDVIQDARVWNGLFLDVFIYPESRMATVDESLLKLRGGIVLMEKEKLGTQLLQEIEKLYLAGPKRLRPDEIQARRTWSKKMLERSKIDDIEGDFRRHWLLIALIEDYFLIRGWWYRGPKESFLWLKNNCPELFKLYEMALKSGATLETLSTLVDEIDKDIHIALNST